MSIGELTPLFLFLLFVEENYFARLLGLPLKGVVSCNRNNACIILQLWTQAEPAAERWSREASKAVVKLETAVWLGKVQNKYSYCNTNWHPFFVSILRNFQTEAIKWVTFLDRP